MKAIMYHYVREFADDHPNFRFLDVSNFRKQLQFFAKQYGFVEKEEWLEYISTGSMPRKQGKVLLTFDDAMSCHYQHVFPELLDRGLWGIFYVPTNPYKLGTMLNVHKIHLLCGRFEGDQLLEIASDLLTDEMIPDKRIKAFETDTYRLQSNSCGVTEFKRLMNYFIGYEHREKILDLIASKLRYSFSTAEFYVPFGKLLEMAGEGMIIGSHTASHPVMSKLTYEEQFLEIQSSFSVLSEVVGAHLKTYCHPYGGQHDFNKNTIRALKACDVSYSFSVEPREITSNDFVRYRHELPRYDCNYFKYGRVS